MPSISLVRSFIHPLMRFLFGYDTLHPLRGKREREGETEGERDDLISE